MNTYTWNKYYLYLAAAVLVVFQGEVASVVAGQVELSFGFAILALIKAVNAGVVATLAYIHQNEKQ